MCDRAFVRTANTSTVNDKFIDHNRSMPFFIFSSQSGNGLCRIYARIEMFLRILK